MVTGAIIGLVLIVLGKNLIIMASGFQTEFYQGYFKTVMFNQDYALQASEGLVHGG